MNIMIGLFKLLSNISIHKKLWLLMFLWVLVLVSSFALVVDRFIDDFNEREYLARHESAVIIEKQLTEFFTEVDNLSLMYLLDHEISQTNEMVTNSNVKQGYIFSKDIQELITSQLFIYDYINKIVLYHTNEELNYPGVFEYYGQAELSEELNTFFENNDYIVQEVIDGELHFYRKIFGRTHKDNQVIEFVINMESLTDRLHQVYYDTHDSTTYLLDMEDRIVISTGQDQSGELLDIESVVESKNMIITPYSYKNLFEGWKIFTISTPQSIFVNQRNLLMWFVLFGLFVVVLVLMTYYFGNNISIRLMKLNRAMLSSRDNERKQICESLGKDEIGITADIYNEMVESMIALMADRTTVNEALMASNEKLAEVNDALVASHRERQVQDDKIFSLIYEDALTGLKNRHAIFEVIDDALKNVLQKEFSIIFLNIDNFKYINDTHGHDVGDRVITETGKRLKELMSNKVSIGRFGGDEFIILIRCNEEAFLEEKTLERLKTIFAKPLYVEHQCFYLTVSMGVSRYPFDGNVRYELIKKADQALNLAKESGKNKYVIYDDTIGEDIYEKMAFQTEVKKGFKNREFHLNYQPYYDAKTQKIKGFEALIRWNSEALGKVSPFKLITNAEEMGLIVDIGKWVFIEACKVLNAFVARYEERLTMSINISALQLMDENFYDFVTRTIKKMGIDPSLICLEMTETVLIDSFERSSSTVQKLRDLGFGIAIDDFGTGYSSLKYFKELSISTLKIDKAFIEHMATSSYDRDLIKVMIRIAHNKGIEVVAEGVETFEQLRYLESYDCDTLQGFLLSQPLPEDKIMHVKIHQAQSLYKL